MCRSVPYQGTFADADLPLGCIRLKELGGGFEVADRIGDFDGLDAVPVTQREPASSVGSLPGDATAVSVLQADPPCLS